MAISPLALEAVRRIDALFEIERSINGHSAEQRLAVRQELSAALVADLESWLREQRAKLSRGNDVAKAMEYMLKRWAAFTRFLDDGRIRLSNNGKRYELPRPPGGYDRVLKRVGIQYCRICSTTAGMSL